MPVWYGKLGLWIFDEILLHIINWERLLRSKTIYQVYCTRGVEGLYIFRTPPRVTKHVKLLIALTNLVAKICKYYLRLKLAFNRLYTYLCNKTTNAAVV